ncbi:hydrogenase subunit MbhD domain-containing protein [Hespellia stercorisuis]|uniref:Uncharacterized MnhB-related membrane protein n=1 Tax=Hespellia stercorisuis DSM 15480 TaxID=1121950 RepID=A0A1M6HKP5_9FIRM|nr:hydrogenase subunit MbhD domain-containing protein [Hespellia stercorisuis]SHJ22740.1 Uncharacterized MnhB-related membrane protein [Hespellia stercorisuis DSM 15480]
MTTIFMWILLIFLVVCAVAVSFTKNILNSILIFMSYSLIMSVIWIMLESPDLAITEAAVGAGVTSLLFFVTLKKIGRISSEDEKEVENGSAESSDETGSENES